MSVFIDNNTVNINRINNKILIKKRYVKNIYNINESGYYTLYFNDSKYIGYNSSYFNKIRQVIDKRLKKVFKNELYRFSKVLFLNENQI